MSTHLSPRFARPVYPALLQALRVRLQQWRLIFVATCLLLLAACGPGATQGSAGVNDVQSGQAGAPLGIADGWLRVPVAGRDVSSGYISIQNKGKEVIELLSFRSPEVRAIELHEHRHSDGMMQMRRVGEKLLEAGESFHMEPGGYHLMLFGVSDSLQAGSIISVEVVYASGDSIEVGKVSLTAREAG